jgi:hypothetical protein
LNVDNSTFENLTHSNIDSLKYGGLIGLDKMYYLKVENSTFVYITIKGFNGGIFGLRSDFSTMLIEKCCFLNVVNTYSGGAIHFQIFSSNNNLLIPDPINIGIDNSTFSFLKANKGGAIYISDTSILPLIKCLFTNNIATDQNGGNDIYAEQADIYGCLQYLIILFLFLFFFFYLFFFFFFCVCRL